MINKTEYLITAQERIKDLESEEGPKMKGTNKFKYLVLIIPKKGTTQGEIKNRLVQTEPLSIAESNFMGLIIQTNLTFNSG